MADGYRLPLRRWGDPDRARVLVLGLHGFNDYGNAFALLGDFLAERGALVYAYDQRGFGATAQRGRWAGEDRLVEDLRAVAGLLRARHPRLPLFLVGESMGGAVALAAAPDLAGARGLVLIAPAVWSRDSMGALQRLTLWAAVRSVPGLRLSGRGLRLRPTDNLARWRAWSADPLVIKGTRVDALWGVTNLMDRAAAAAPALRTPTLLLYGMHDEIVPKDPVCTLIGRLAPLAPGMRVAIYPQGWHMLTRDLQGAWVLADIAAWIDDWAGPLPSGRESPPGGAALGQFCAGGPGRRRDRRGRCAPSARGSPRRSGLRICNRLNAPESDRPDGYRHSASPGGPRVRGGPLGPGGKRPSRARPPAAQRDTDPNHA
jgi:alpha-beta hydrolase superfamily lysophospholipase